MPSGHLYTHRTLDGRGENTHCLPHSQHAGFGTVGSNDCTRECITTVSSPASPFERDLRCTFNLSVSDLFLFLHPSSACIMLLEVLVLARTTIQSKLDNRNVHPWVFMLIWLVYTSERPTS